MSDSLLAAKLKSTPPTNHAVWDKNEAAVELLILAIEAITISPAASVQCTITNLGTLSVSGSVIAGALSVQMVFSSDFDGVVAGMTITGVVLAAYLFPPNPGFTYPAIVYTVSAGSITGYKTI